MDMSRDRYVSMAEARERLGVHRQTVYEWAWRGELPSVKIGGRRLVPMAWVESQVGRTVRVGRPRKS
ncbi:helix-turn-helix domain-containing protein [Tautonia sociabilis]|uniref:DNA-binding protein n=1 Tax=Tautonia sociabilis TaxID=2080755 RepID=A0A432MKF2_9BACT|nr:DNA-binding protein [Tautonia sociabilis]